MREQKKFFSARMRNGKKTYFNLTYPRIWNAGLLEALSRQSKTGKKSNVEFYFFENIINNQDITNSYF